MTQFTFEGKCWFEQAEVEVCIENSYKLNDFILSRKGMKKIPNPIEVGNSCCFIVIA